MEDKGKDMPPSFTDQVSVIEAAILTSMNGGGERKGQALPYLSQLSINPCNTRRLRGWGWGH